MLAPLLPPFAITREPRALSDSSTQRSEAHRSHACESACNDLACAAHFWQIDMHINTAPVAGISVAPYLSAYSRFLSASSAPSRAAVPSAPNELGARREADTAFSSSLPRGARLDCGTRCVVHVAREHSTVQQATTVCGRRSSRVMERTPTLSNHARYMQHCSHHAHTYIPREVHAARCVQHGALSNQLCGWQHATCTYLRGETTASSSSSRWLMTIYHHARPPPSLGPRCSLTSAFAQAVAEQDAEVVLAHVFVDEPYHRTGYRLASASSNRVRTGRPCRQTSQNVPMLASAGVPCRLPTMVVCICQAALGMCDFELAKSTSSPNPAKVQTTRTRVHAARRRDATAGARGAARRRPLYARGQPPAAGRGGPCAVLAAGRRGRVARGAGGRCDRRRARRGRPSCARLLVRPYRSRPTYSPVVQVP